MAVDYLFENKDVCIYKTKVNGKYFVLNTARCKLCRRKAEEKDRLWIMTRCKTLYRTMESRTLAEISYEFGHKLSSKRYNVVDLLPIADLEHSVMFKNVDHIPGAMLDKIKRLDLNYVWGDSLVLEMTSNKIADRVDDCEVLSWEPPSKKIKLSDEDNLCGNV